MNRQTNTGPLEEQLPSRALPIAYNDHNNLNVSSPQPSRSLPQSILFLFVFLLLVPPWSILSYRYLDPLRREAFAETCTLDDAWKLFRRIDLEDL